MNPREVFERYKRQFDGIAVPGFRSEVFPGFHRSTPTSPGEDGWIQFARLSHENVDTVIQEQKAYFKSLGFGFEWKHHDFDTPDNLKERLLSHGFKPDDTEALMVYDVEAHAPWPGQLPNGIHVDRIGSIEKIADVADANARANDEPWPPLTASLTRAFDRTSIFCAYDGAVPIGTGWIEFPPGAEFAEIHGGGVVPAYRGKGIYSALFEARVQEAAKRGVPLIVVDAGPMSRPILLRKGFQFICETTPFRMAR